MDYRDFRPSSPAAPPDNKAPGLVLFVNFPPDETDPAFRDVLALYCPVFTMFSESGPFESVIMEQYAPDRRVVSPFPTTLPFTTYKESILGWFPNTPSPPGSTFTGTWTLNQLGLTRPGNDYYFDPEKLLARAMEFGAARLTDYPAQFLYVDTALLKSKCFLNALDSNKHVVFKARTITDYREDTSTPKKQEVVDGLIKAMWRWVEGEDPLCSVGLKTGGIMSVPPLLINYKSGQSALSTDGLLPSAGSRLKPADYVADVSNQLIASAGRVNMLLNVLQDFRLDGPQVIPPNLKIEVGGHTDKVGPEDGPNGNKALSLKRAKAVVKFLVDNRQAVVSFGGTPDKHKQDFISERLKPVGHGSDDCNTADNVPNSEARKVTFRIVKSAN